MMTQISSFPPFIHPYEDKSHLPEPLADCMSIAVLYVARNCDTRSFLWKAIQEEQERNIRQKQVENYTKHEVLAALQAEILYIVMRVVDSEGMSAEDREYNLEMILAYSAFWKLFMLIADNPCTLDSSKSVSWEDWILNEFCTRVACVWFLIAQTACVKVGIGCYVLESWKGLPLPCRTGQWAASTQEAWREEIISLSYSQNSSHQIISSFGELLESEKLDTWNSGADNVGNLLNLATTIT
ncbi:hypothetical protein LZ30DRAFT_752054 [Colletotrichum cereale]|nr:hypothetical protein LZ30DRAFT_752054 [Colletotrichum cereale]